MVYSEAVNVQAQTSGIASSKDVAKTFVEHLVMQTACGKLAVWVFDVLGRQVLKCSPSQCNNSSILG
uniref:Uncharacterized protein n=1 Tax=Parelaphostrongylus tenuis TaxID=148309 RepID=A0AAD5M772_PARTN|nr:hypothetical protein KIN20_007044 [Parelaphostrongylus tenuis]